VVKISFINNERQANCKVSAWIRSNCRRKTDRQR